MATIESIPTLADLLSIETEVELNGKVYKLRPPTLLEQGKYQRHLEEQARQSVSRATYLSEAELESGQNAITRDISAGLYCWGGPICVQALQTPDGVAKLLEIVLDIPTPEARKLVDGHLARIVALLRAAIDDDPKAIALALKTLGLPSDFLKVPGKKPSSSSGSATRRSTKRKRKSRR